MENNSFLFKKNIKNILYAVAIIAIFFIMNTLIATRTIGSYPARIIMGIGLNITLAVSLNLIIGFTGQLTLGHLGFMAIGAYSAAMATKLYHIPFILALICGALLAGLVAFLIGYPILRLKGDYLAICTLGFGEIVKVIIQNMESIGGPRGLSGIPPKTNFAWIYFTMIFAILLVRNILKSSQGRAMISIREDEIAAESMGINAAKYKIIAFAIGAAIAGFAGGLYAHYYMFIDPNSFNFLRSMDVLIFVVFGGMGSLSGSVIAAAVLTYLPEALRPLKDYRIIIYAVSLIILMIFRPQGLLGTKEIKDVFKGFGKSKKKGGDKHGIIEG